MDDFKRPVQSNTSSNDPVNSLEGPETYETSTGQPAQLEPTPPVVQEKKKSNVGKWIVWGLVALLLAGLGALAYFQWVEAENAKKEVTSLQTSLDAAQDAARENDASDSAKPVTEPVSKNDKDLRAESVVLFLATLTGEDAKYVVKDEVVSGSHAAVRVGPTATLVDNPSVVLEKSGDVWVVLHYGDVRQEDEDKLVKSYGVPVALLKDR